MTPEELLAKIRASGSAAWDEKGAILRKIVGEEESLLQSYWNKLTNLGSEAEEKDWSRKNRASKARLALSVIGSIIGFAAGGPGGAKAGATVGAGVGSFGGSKLAQVTEPGGWKLGGTAGPMPEGMFLKGAREKADSKALELKRFFSKANEQYNQSAAVNALRDAYSAHSLLSLPKSEDWIEKLFAKESTTNVPSLLGDARGSGFLPPRAGDSQYRVGEEDILRQLFPETAWQE